MKQDREVEFEEGKQIAKEFSFRFIETSAKEALNITLAFHTLALDIMARFDAGEKRKTNIRGHHLKPNNNRPK